MSSGPSSLNDAIDRETVELFRSKEMLARKEREAKTADETALIGEEKLRLRRHQDELRRLVKAACLAGSVSFRGNDRSPDDRAVDMGKSAADILGDVLPEVFDRFKEAAARPADVKKGVDALFTAENLQGLPSVFGSLGLLRDEKGKTVFRVESGASGGGALPDRGARQLRRHRERPVPRRRVREGAVRLGLRSRSLARPLAAARRKDSGDQQRPDDRLRDRDRGPRHLFEQQFFPPGLVPAEEGHRVRGAREGVRGLPGHVWKRSPELNAGAIVSELRKEIARHEDPVASAHGQLIAYRLPGAAVLEGAIGQMKAILRGSEDNAIATFNASHRSIKDAIKRAAELEQALSEPRLRDLDRAREALRTAWPFLRRSLM